MKTLTVFTPSYNRAYTLPRLYKSLCEQTCSDFCWLVVDDGSTDNTKELIDSYIDEGLVQIKYLMQENGGKQRAHNTGVGVCDTELFFCLDSDDRLRPESVEIILDTWKRYSGNAKVAGIIGVCGISDSEPLGSWFPKGIELSTMWDMYYKYGVKGDTAHIYRTDVLRQFPFYVEPDEKFVSETTVYHQIDQHYVLAVIPEIISICEYMGDGYTKNARRVTRNNPKGYMRLKRLKFEMSTSPLLKLENMTLYLVGACLAHSVPDAVKSSPNRWLAVLCLLPALILSKTEFQR